ncbi:hypothetical protein E4U55_004876 [Claviceps digitariae]|nr:hypothetical protein E4U55_004876 [Claviceps digitariae]
MASADADSPEVTTFGPSSSAGGSSIGVKRGPDGNVVGRGQAPDAATAGDYSKKKRKKTGTASRGVANLTPEQLAKKRANDREAQRAIRERTKNQIDALERRIEELTKLKPYQELQAVLRAKEAVERENAEIKRQLAGIMNVLKPIVGTAADEVTQHRPFIQPVSVAQSPASHPHCAPTPMAASSMSPPAAANSSHPQQDASPCWAESQNTPSDGQLEPAMLQLHNQRLQLRQGLSLGGEKLGLDFLLRPGQQVNRVQAASHGAQDTPHYQHVPMKHDGVLFNFSSGKEPWTPPSASRLLPDYAGHDADQQASGPHQDQLDAFQPRHPGDGDQNSPLHLLPIKNSESTCPLDTILLNFLSERRQRIAEGLPIHEVIGPRYPSVSSLLNPANSVYSHPLSKVFTDVLARFPDISRLPERIAVLYVMFLVMRWQICPTRENYERLPTWMTPQQSQLDYAHPAWIDNIPFPAMRERLARIWISKPGEYELEQFFIPYTTTLRVSWPYEETDALLILPDCDDVVINPVFERHMRNIDNWKLGESFARAFPELADTFGMDPTM